MEKIQDKLFKYQDITYREFNSKLIPNIDKKTMIGVRIPDIRKIEKSLSVEEKKQFLMDLPHKYFEENMLHRYNNIKYERV